MTDTITNEPPDEDKRWDMLCEAINTLLGRHAPQEILYALAVSCEDGADAFRDPEFAPELDSKEKKEAAADYDRCARSMSALAASLEEEDKEDETSDLAKEYDKYLRFRASWERCHYELSLGFFERGLRDGEIKFFGVAHDGVRLIYDYDNPAAWRAFKSLM